MQLVKPHTARVAGWQARRKAAHLLLYCVDFSKNDETRIQSDDEHRRNNGRADSKGGRPGPEQGHRGEREERQYAGAVCNVVKTRKNCAKNSATEQAAVGRLGGLENLECRRRDDGAQYDHPA